MKAAIYTEFKGHINIENVNDPICPKDGIVLKVKSTGICRSDWHGWQGHDSDIRLPHVPGHEIAGEIVETGSFVKNWKKGDRVTFPFVCGCGTCTPCDEGNPQVCDFQFQPGFTHWGSFAEFVAIKYADSNLVRIPEFMDFTETAALGCRFITSFRAVKNRGQIKDGQWLAVYGCGGIGLSAVMIGKALGASVIAIDISSENLNLAKSFGAEKTINPLVDDPIEAIKDFTGGGVHVSIDALGSKDTAINSILSLRKLGKHVQVGLLAGEQSRPELPMEIVIANELEILGSHGMAASQYPEIFELIEKGNLSPEKLVNQTVDLVKGVNILKDMNSFRNPGITVITEF